MSCRSAESPRARGSLGDPPRFRIGPPGDRRNWSLVPTDPRHREWLVKRPCFPVLVAGESTFRSIAYRSFPGVLQEMDKLQKVRSRVALETRKDGMVNLSLDLDGPGARIRATGDLSRQAGENLSVLLRDLGSMDIFGARSRSLTVLPSMCRRPGNASGLQIPPC